MRTTETGEATSQPVLLVVDAGDADRSITESALARRFGGDYTVIATGNAQEGFDLLSEYTVQGRDVALVAADLHLPSTGGIKFLGRAHELHPKAVRVLLVPMDEFHTRIPFTELPALQRANVLGQADYWILKGWTTPEEWLYPQVQEALTAWTVANRPRHLVYRIVGLQWDPRSHELRDVLTRSGVPFAFHGADSDEGQRLIRVLGIETSQLPALIQHDNSVLLNPSTEEVAAAHGVRTRPSPGIFDLVVIGSGPTGLGTAVYGASEGLRTLVVEQGALGGQAATSSMIRNYLGFPRGVSGGELTHRAWEQAVFFGAEFVFIHAATKLAGRGNHRMIVMDDGGEIAARAVVIATGVEYRRLGIPSLDRFVGAGVFYGAATAEAPAMADMQVYVVGGANSSGQAAIHLARFAARVVLLVRGESLASGMSDYLIKQLEATPNIEVRLNTRVVDGHGGSRLEELTLEQVSTGSKERVSADGVFVLIGAEPHTEWLRGSVCLDDRGYILTGPDVPPAEWRQKRAPLPFETSWPGVFAAGDVRYGSAKRVASAAGEGSVSVGSVHRYLSGLE